MKRKHSVLTKKIVLRVMIFAFILCSFVFAVGYLAFTHQFKNEYDRTILSIAEASRECLNPDDFGRYLETKETDEAYNSVFNILQDFVDKFDLNLLYVSNVEGENYTNITYIYNPVKQGGKWKPFELGYFEVYEEPEYNASARNALEKGETVVRHTLKTRSGSHITAMLPVYDSSGKAVAVLGAQKNIQEFVNARYTYVNVVVVSEFIFALLFGILFSSYIRFAFIKPLTLITRETDHFASYGGRPSDSLLKIKNRDEIGTLAHSVHQMEDEVCTNIEKLTQVTAEKERIGTELSVATKIQYGMLPKGYPTFPDRTDFDLAATMTPAKEVGGDFYDYRLLDSDHLMIVVGDVSGKGIPAALIMAIVKTLIASYAQQGLSPKKIFETVNNQLCKRNTENYFVTCWLAILTFSTGELKFVNAGHPYPVLHQGGEFSYLKTKPNFVLAGMENFPYEEHSVILKKGDRIFIYTDGVTEATDEEEQLFGDDRVLESMSRTEELTAPETLKFVRSQIDKFVGRAEQFDDLTMLTLILK